MTQQEAPGTINTALWPDDVRQQSPQGETEAAVERVFAEMLDLPALPRTASLFDLGLDSMSVTIACARLEQITKVRVRFTQIFRTPTVAQLSAWIDTARGKAGNEQDIRTKPLAPEGDELVAITPVQAETVPQKIVVDFAWWFDGKIDEAALRHAATDVHRRHQALHARYLSGPELGLAEVPADPGQVEFHRLDDENSDDAAVGALRRTLRLPLELDQGHIWRCVLVRNGLSGRTLFGLALDHSGFDGHSWGILTAELSTAYTARSAGHAPQWPGRTASLAEMACDFRHQLATADTTTQRQYWAHELHNLPACELPPRSDGKTQIPPMPDNSRYSLPGPAALRDFLIPKAQLQPWDDYARTRGMPPSVAIAAVYIHSIIQTGAAPDFAVMVPIANKSGKLIDQTITNRVGNIVLRPNGPTHKGPHILARTRDAYLQAMAARDVLIIPEELGTALSGTQKLIQLDRFVALNYTTTPELNLANTTGTLLNEGATLSTQSRFAVMLTVSPTTQGLDITLQVRTDMHDPHLTYRIKQHILDTIKHGPHHLEQQTT